MRLPVFILFCEMCFMLVVLIFTCWFFRNKKKGRTNPMDISEAVCQSVYVAKDKCGCVMASTLVVEIEEDLQLFNQVALMVRQWIEKGWKVEKTSGPVLVAGCKCQKAASQKNPEG